MREILFRGKCTDTGKWYEGQYIHLHKTTYCFKEDYEKNPGNDIHQIVFEQMTDWCLPNRHLRADVIPETVGQYTGLTDKNGKKIFEGDIVKWNINFAIVWQDCKFVLKKDINAKAYDYVLSCFNGAELKVIGNIHDNPELLKGGEG